MLLPDGAETDSWVSSFRQELSEYSNKIETCITREEWDMLAQVLDDRQAYLDKKSLEPMPESRRDSVKQIAKAVLDQDADFQARVQQQKEIVTRQQLSIEHGRRVVKAYNNS